MDLRNIGENEKLLLQLLWEQEPMETGRLTALCKERLSWSAFTVRRLLGSLKKRNVVKITGRGIESLITKEQLEAADWNNWVGNAFDLPDSAKPASKPRRFASRKLWLGAALAAVLVITVIAMIFLPAPLPEELAPCKAALDQWQSSEICHITLQYQRSGYAYNVLSAADAGEYWRSGSDWIRFSYHSDPGIGNMGTMYRDGITYDNIDTEQGTIWVPAEIEQQEPAGMWPLTFAWDCCEYIYKGIEETQDSKRITFAVVETDPDQPHYNDTPYHVCFSFDNNEQLESVSVTLVEAGPYVTICTYRLVSTDTAEIAKYIQEQAVLTAAPT